MADTWSPYDPPRADITTSPSGGTSGRYFTTGPLKFSLMSLTTFGFYVLYWFYKNWQILRERGEQVSPFWRAVFAPLWTFSMGKYLTERAAERDIPLRLPATALGLTYIFLNVTSRLPDPYWVVSLLGFVAILPFDAAARLIDGNGSLATPTYGKFSVWNVIWLAFGTLFLGLMVLGLMLPEV